MIKINSAPQQASNIGGVIIQSDTVEFRFLLQRKKLCHTTKRHARFTGIGEYPTELSNRPKCLLFIGEEKDE